MVNKDFRLKAACAVDVCSVRYPPYTDKKTGMLSWVLKKSLKSDKVLLSFLPIVIIGVLLGICLKVA